MDQCKYDVNQIGRNRLVLIPHQPVTGRERQEFYDRLVAAQPLLCDKIEQRFTKAGLKKSGKAKVGKAPRHHLVADLRVNVRTVELFLSRGTETGDRFVTQLIAGIP